MQAEVTAAEKEAASESAPASEPATSMRGVGRETDGILLCAHPGNAYNLHAEVLGVGRAASFLAEEWYSTECCFTSRKRRTCSHENFKQKFVISFYEK